MGLFFTGRTGWKEITSAAIWKGLKNIAKELGIPEETVFSYSFRRLFAKNYMDLYKNIICGEKKKIGIA